VTLAADGDYATIDLLGGFKTMGGVQQGVTVTRMHVILTVITASDPEDNFAWGVIRGQQSDQGVNIVGAPKPSTQPYEDWLMWELLTADTDGHYWPGGGNVWRYDIKSRRKLEDLQMSLNIVFESLTAATPFTVTMQVRTLLLLP
jgi:hypothetical protein